MYRRPEHDWIIVYDTLHFSMDCIYQISSEWATLTWQMIEEYTLFHHLHTLTKTHTHTNAF